MKILVTGGCGFIGSHLVDRLIKDQHEIVIVDDFSTGKKENIKNHELKIFEHSVIDYPVIESIIKTEKPDIIYHLAAIASVQRCKEEPLYSSEVNSGSTLRLLDFATRHNVRHFIFSSSAAVYGNDPILPKKESSQIAPISIYGIDKYASEQYVMEYHRLKKLKGTAFRFFNVFGPRQDPNSPYSGVLSIFKRQIVDQNSETITIFGDGKQSRDFIFVQDIVQALVLPLSGDSVSGSVYNVATGKSISLLDVLSSFESHTERKINIDFQNARLGDIKYSEADISKLKAQGFSANYSFDEGLRQYIKEDE